MAALCLGFGSVAAAQPNEEAVRFQYQAPAECPDAASFMARVRKRTTRGREAAPEELARSFDISVAVDRDGFVGTIAFLDDGGAKVSRRVGGEQCEAVVDSLALITALALDATLHEPEPPSEPAEEPSPKPVPPVAPIVARVTPEATPATPPRESSPRSVHRLKSARVGLAGGYDSAIDAFPVGLLAQLDWQSGWSLRFDAHFASSERTVDAGRRAELRLVGLESSGCYLVFADQDLSLSPCVWLDLGSLRASGVKSETLTTAGSKTIFWASAGPELRVAWEPALPVWVELRGMLGFPLVSRDFRFKQPDQRVYEVPRFTQSGSLVAGVRFW